MNKTKTAHTPGPWYSEMNVDGEVNTWAFDNPGSPRIGIARIYKHNGKAQEANGALIAAAPDLLAALGKMVNFYEEGIDDEKEREINKQARAAISKAKGE